MHKINYAQAEETIKNFKNQNKEISKPIFLKEKNQFINQVVPPHTLKFSSDSLKLKEIANPCLLFEINNLSDLTYEMLYLIDYIILLNEHKVQIGWITSKELLNYKLKESKKISNILKNDLSAIFESDLGTIVFSDIQGNILRLSSQGEELWNFDTKKLESTTIFDLENKNIFNPSATRLAIETGKKVQLIQQTHTGKRLSVTGYPIKDKNNKITRVMSISKDISEKKNLEQELRLTYDQLASYRNEINNTQTKQSDRMIYSSKRMEELQESILRISGVDSTILVTGESGVGKEMVVNKIHNLSSRSKHPIIAINCASIPESLLESELFGYEPGSFTGANSQGKVGLFKQAHESTLFLDEIGELSYSLQSTLLRVLQEGTITPIGSTKPIEVNVRVISATNKNLEKEVENGNFREDLYYRINVIPLKVPPLRERTDDILPLIHFFMEYFYKKHGFKKRFSPSAIQALENYEWPGNIRELRNLIEQINILVEKDFVEVDDLPHYVIEAQKTFYSNQPITVNKIIPLNLAKTLAEEQLIKMTYKKLKTTVAVAKSLDINQSTASRKINEYIKKRINK